MIREALEIAAEDNLAELLARRRRLLGPNVPTFYEHPLHIVRGNGVWLWDSRGRKYLDCYNNVPHVGHCHPRVVEAIAQQCGTLNTHTRYVHDAILEYFEKLLTKFHRQLGSGILTCSGSEANDVALRMAQVFTNRTGIVATDNTYHGNTALVSQLSDKNAHIGGDASNVVRIAAPVGQATRYQDMPEDESQCFAGSVSDAIALLESRGRGCAALIVCPYFANEGFPALPEGFLSLACARVRAAGGLVICDEVQPGFGRLGSHFWGHERAGIQPDIVTLGKPMGNGHPVAGIVARSDVLAAFRRVFRYFNTFGGNPVAVAAARATLETIEDEGLVDNALRTGRYARQQLRHLAGKWPVLGAVRGSGLYFGVEICDVDCLPDPRLASRLINAMRHTGVLVSTTGRFGSLLKIRPPMPIAAEEIDMLVDSLDNSLRSMQ